MNNSATIAEQKEWRPSWISRSAISFVSISFYLTLIGLGFAVHFENYWVAVPLMLVCAHCMHGLLIGFHEASHGMLRKNRRFNDFEGYLIGTFSFLGFTLYRVAHQSHHSHMGTQRDEELWPFVEPTVPRWGRVLAAFLELTCGIFFTPFVFVRSFLRKGSTIRSKRIRRRIWIELGVIVVFWTLVLTTVHLLGIWRYFLLVYALPAILAGNLQSWRKYIEHVGLTGSTVRSGTRSIVANNWAGRLVSFTLLHEPYHGVHHLHMGLPHAELPGRADSLQPETPEELPPFRSYGHALVHLLRSLADPRVGSQWHQRKGGVTPGREPADLAN
jgi:fatty acid desaturase